MTFFSGHETYLEKAEVLKDGCGRYFKPWGDVDEKTGAEESSWKCGDEWNGKKLLCDCCKKKAKELIKKINEKGCKELISTGVPPLIHSCCKPCIGLLKGRFPYDSMCKNCQEAIKILEEILKCQ